MSKINELIQTLCPDGVEYKKLGEVAEYAKGRILATDVDENTYVGVDNLLQNCRGVKESTNVPAEGTVIQFLKKDILIGNIRPYLKKAWLADRDGGTNGDVLAIRVKDENEISSDFLYVILSSDAFFEYDMLYAKGAKMPRGDKNVVMMYPIPVPPLPVQEEIVRILDEYTELETELEAKLSEEIELKQKQYEFYRACLFNVKNADILKIGDFTQVFSASRVHKSDWKSEGVRFWRSSDLMSYFNGVENPRGKVFISYELYEKLSAKSGKIRKYDILITGGGSIGVPYLVPDDEPLYVKDADLLCIQRNDRVDSEYLYFYFLTSEFRDYLKDITHDATIAHYTISQIKETPVPVPSMTEQRKIVKALKELKTEMDAIISTLNTELESRKKQYAYYRDQLLTFKRKE